MATALITHKACLDHTVPAGHPERPARLQAVLEGLAGSAFVQLQRNEAPKASREALNRAHAPSHIETIFACIPKQGFARIDADTALSPGSGEAALRAAGAVLLAVDLVMDKSIDNAFCAVRPPGHHAERERAMGFCLFNNVAIGALHARAVHGLSRIAVVDFDVHHGNGTQDIFWDDPNLFYASTHQSPFYPGTGAREERGAAGNIVNAPLPAGAGSAAFRDAMTGRILPALEAFAPEFLFISAGFDAHAADPLAGLMLEADDFAWATSVLMGVARKMAAGRLVSALEGGYDLEALSACAAAHVGALMEH